jgi:hypothetical protein
MDRDSEGFFARGSKWRFPALPRGSPVDSSRGAALKPLQTMGMQKGWIYEVIVSTYRDDKPHSAPIGIWTHDFLTLNMEIYSGSGTLKSIMELKDFVVNMVADVTAFYDSLFDKANVAYRHSSTLNAPVLSNASAIIGCRLNKAENKGNKVHLECVPVNIEVNEPVKLINRAEAIVVESLILATRMPYLEGSKARETLKENYRIVRKVAPGSRYERIVEKLVEAKHAPASSESHC